MSPGARPHSIESVGDLLFGDINQWRVFDWSNGEFAGRILSGMDALLYGEYFCLGRRVFGGYLHAERPGKRPEIPRKLYENSPKLYISTTSLRKLYENIPNEKRYENIPKTLREHCENAARTLRTRASCSCPVGNYRCRLSSKVLSGVVHFQINLRVCRWAVIYADISPACSTND